MRITLNKISVTNFKGFAKVDKLFNPKEETIYAENGQGKTTLRDAWFWLLGFNVSDVIPCIDNKEIPNLEINVTAEVSIFDGTAESVYTLTRVQKENRKTNKDTGVEEKVNNESSYLIDGTPFTFRSYKDKISELFGVSYEKLQMLCQMEFFNTDNGEKWKWSHRRKELFDLCRVDELLADMVGKECYALIAGDIKKKYSTTEIKKAIRKELAGYSSEKEKNAILIADKQNEIAKYAGIDFAALEAERTSLENSVTDVMVSGSKRTVNEQLVRLQNEKSEITTQIFRIKAEDAHSRGEIESKIAFITSELSKTQSRAENLKQEMESARAAVTALEDENARIESAVWNGDTICPTCGQSLPEGRIELSKKNFEEDKAKRLSANSKSIDKKLEFLLSAKQTLADYRQTYSNLRSQKNEYEKELAKFNTAEKVAPLEAKVAELNEQISLIEHNDTSKVDVSAVVEPMKRRISEINSTLGYKRIISEFASRVEQLKSLNKELTDREMTAKEKVRQIDEYVREQVKLVTEVINGKFRNGVRFSLFNELYAGSEHEIKEECICVLNGKTYSEMSHGERFLADLEVTKVLQEQYGVDLPIFLDNAECFTGDISAEQQIILLYAKKGSFIDGVKIEVIL